LAFWPARIAHHERPGVAEHAAVQAVRDGHEILLATQQEHRAPLCGHPYGTQREIDRLDPVGILAKEAGEPAAQRGQPRALRDGRETTKTDLEDGTPARRLTSLA
jgi:hypothetical protein